MIKKLVFLSFHLAIFSACAMEVANVASWAKEATKVHVESIKMAQDVSINDGTTILDIKNYLENMEGIPVGQQRLQTVRNNPWHLWLTRQVSPALMNGRNVKEVMTQYNTNRLALSISLRAHHQDN